MLNKIKNFIDSNNLLNAKAKVVLAFSFGIDSRVLLDVLLKLGYEVVLAHVNHHHRKESEMEAKEALKLANDNNLKIYIYDLVEDHTKNFHSDAHEKRYQFFMDVAKKENTKYIVTAHHQNDNLETILLNIIKGSNLYGYSGIAPKVMLNDFDLIRPLLTTTKDEIKKYQQENNLTYYEDSSNGENLFRRNRIRHNVIPILMDENPNLFENVMHYSSILRSAFSLIRGKSIELVTLWKNKINVHEYTTLEEAIRKDTIAFMLEEEHIQRSFNLISQIDDILMSNDPQKDITLNNNFIFKKRYDEAYITQKRDTESIRYELYENNVILTKNMRFYFTKILPTNNAKYLKLCYNNLVYPIILRNRKPGDTIKMKYGHKKIKNLFIDLHIPNEKREETLLLENNGEILWVCDYAKSEKLIEMKENADIYLVYEVRNES